jgi:hypothetical protein
MFGISVFPPKLCGFGQNAFARYPKLKAAPGKIEIGAPLIVLPNIQNFPANVCSAGGRTNHAEDIRVRVQ